MHLSRIPVPLDDMFVFGPFSKGFTSIENVNVIETTRCNTAGAFFGAPRPKLRCQKIGETQVQTNI